MNFDLECHVFNIPDQNLSHCGLVIRPRDIRRHHEVLRQEGMDHKIHGTAKMARRRSAAIRTLLADEPGIVGQSHTVAHSDFEEGEAVDAQPFKDLMENAVLISLRVY
jgi:hypothetical protein